MSDKGVDLIVYLLLTLGASAIGWFKASKEKKAKNTPPEFHLPEEEHDDLDDEIVVISQEPEIPSPEPVFAPISIPRLGSSIRRILGSVRMPFPITTFC